MTREFVYVSKFSEKWGKLSLTDDDLIPLENYILENPHAGKVIKGTGGLRKLRWVLPSIGKSGGLRVLYIDVVAKEKIYMVDLFAKGLKEDLTEVEKSKIKQLAMILKGR
jgi:hypothetical protein